MIKERISILIEKIKNEAMSFYGERLISLAVFGSAAKGTMRSNSDLDFLICAKNLPRGRRARLKEFQKVEDSLNPLLKEQKREGINTALSPVIKTPEEVEFGSLLFLDMIDNAIVLYDRDSFFANYLKRLNEKLKNLGSKKIKWGSSWYWELFPFPKPAGEVAI